MTILVQMEGTLAEALYMPSPPDNEEYEEDEEEERERERERQNDDDDDDVFGGGGGGGGGVNGGGGGGDELLRLNRRALKSLRHCRKENANSFSRACALLLRR